jgi:hypothetical protein
VKAGFAHGDQQFPRSFTKALVGWPARSAGKLPLSELGLPRHIQLIELLVGRDDDKEADRQFPGRLVASVRPPKLAVARSKIGMRALLTEILHEIVQLLGDAETARRREVVQAHQLLHVVTERGREFFGR